MLGAGSYFGAAAVPVRLCALSFSAAYRDTSRLRAGCGSERIPRLGVLYTLRSSRDDSSQLLSSQQQAALLQPRPSLGAGESFSYADAPLAHKHQTLRQLGVSINRLASARVSGAESHTAEGTGEAVRAGSAEMLQAHSLTLPRSEQPTIEGLALLVDFLCDPLIEQQLLFSGLGGRVVALAQQLLQHRHQLDMQQQQQYAGAGAAAGGYPPSMPPPRYPPPMPVRRASPGPRPSGRRRSAREGHSL